MTGGRRHDDGQAAGPEWVWRPVTGAATVKPYRCPGCDHPIATGTPHVVAWESDRVEQRRHWHSPCWRLRERRRSHRG